MNTSNLQNIDANKGQMSNIGEKKDADNTNENWTQRYVDYDKEAPQPRDISNDYIKEEMVGNVRGVFIKTRNLEPNELESSQNMSDTSNINQLNFNKNDTDMNKIEGDIDKNEKSLDTKKSGFSVMQPLASFISRIAGAGNTNENINQKDNLNMNKTDNLNKTENINMNKTEDNFNRNENMNRTENLNRTENMNKTDTNRSDITNRVGNINFNKTDNANKTTTSTTNIESNRNIPGASNVDDLPPRVK